MTGTLNRENATCRWLKAGGGGSTDEQFGTALGSSDLLLANGLQSQQQPFCEPDFDKSLCWFNVSLGSVGHRPCPFQFCSSVPDCEWVQQAFTASRPCHDNGTWGDSLYGECIQLLRQHQRCVVGYCNNCPDPLRDTVIRVSLSLSVVSVCVLLAALVLFSAFDSVQCRRLSIHKNLSAAFVLRFAVLAIWTLVNSQNLFRDCSTFVPQPLRQWEWLCKLLLFGVIFFQVASVMWMLIEGVYLYSRFTVLAMRRSEAPYALYLFTGWGLPFLAVLLWAWIHESNQLPGGRSFCWLPYAQGAHLWILAGTMGVALVLNVLLLLAIVLILVKKLRTESTAESKKIWRTVKSTMLLVPLLGVSNVPLFYEPSKPSAFYMLGSAILQHSQGIFIAVLYCFLNAEIQNALKRQLGKVPLLQSLGLMPGRGRHHFETERTFLAGQTTAIGGEEESGRQLQMQDFHNGRARNGTRRGPRFAGQTVQSNSLTAGLNRHAADHQQPNGAEEAANRTQNKPKGSAKVSLPQHQQNQQPAPVMSSSCGPLLDLASADQEEAAATAEQFTPTMEEAAGSKQRLMRPD